MKSVSKVLDGDAHRPTDSDTCPFSEGCKRHMSPGDILRYSLVIALSVFLFLLVFSLFFPDVVKHPDLNVLRELVNLFHLLLHGGVAPATS